MSKIRTYERDDLVVEYDAARCIHAAECVHGLPQVFDPEKRPWIDPQQAQSSAIETVIRKCPTGALKYRRPDGKSETPEETVRIRVEPDGPLYVSGRIRLGRPDGSTSEDPRVALCRCGASRNKPYCDNSHQGIEFRDAGAVGRSGMPSADGSEEPGVTLTPVPNGPVILSGAIEITGTDGSVAEGGKGALCRCGASANKPFCDGAHKNVGFEAE